MNRAYAMDYSLVTWFGASIWFAGVWNWEMGMVFDEESVSPSYDSEVFIWQWAHELYIYYFTMKQYLTYTTKMQRQSDELKTRKLYFFKFDFCTFGNKEGIEMGFYLPKANAFGN